MPTFQIPKVGVGESELESLIQLWEVVSTTKSEITFSFRVCTFLSHLGVAFLGAMIRHLQLKGKTVHLDWNGISEALAMNLAQNGFQREFGQSTGPWRGNSIPYRHDAALSKNELMQYLRSDWLGRGWVNVSIPLRNVITGVVWEIYENAFEHGHSPFGVFTCGQRYPRQGVLCLAVVDFGVGVAKSVQDYFRRDLSVFFDDDTPDETIISSDSALEWAFKEGTSTAGGARGHGLYTLQSFIKLNSGRLVIRSNRGKATIGSETKFENTALHFKGTIANLTFNCDDKYYRLSSENEEKPLF